jgi:hypothetical protein
MRWLAVTIALVLLAGVTGCASALPASRPEPRSDLSDFGHSGRGVRPRDHPGFRTETGIDTSYIRQSSGQALVTLRRSKRLRFSVLWEDLWMAT